MKKSDKAKKFSREFFAELSFNVGVLILLDALTDIDQRLIFTFWIVAVLAWAYHYINYD